MASTPETPTPPPANVLGLPWRARATPDGSNLVVDVHGSAVAYYVPGPFAYAIVAAVNATTPPPVDPLAETAENVDAVAMVLFKRMGEGHWRSHARAVLAALRARRTP